ncbi:MAG: PEGA domain-containing protein [Candidatus Eisenbacteria bacterium]|nr:PEGA domain-containing protein [Candidatus Eisenbacteria bacterium]
MSCGRVFLPFRSPAGPATAGGLLSAALFLGALVGGCGDPIVEPLTEHGMLSITSVPTHAEIYIDGRDMGVRTPYEFGSFAVGTHTVRCAILTPVDLESVERVTVFVDSLTRHAAELVPAAQVIQPTTPEYAIAKIQKAWGQMNAEQYRQYLSPQFVFRFQEADVIGGSPDSMVLGQELTFASNLFEMGVPGKGLPRASRIGLAFMTLDSGPDPRPRHESWRMYRMSSELSVTFGDGSQMGVRSPVVLYFKPRGDGTWVLAEWVDQPAGAAERIPLEAASSQVLRPLPAARTTWGHLRILYR